MNRSRRQIALAILLAAGPAAAQYTNPGDLGEVRLSAKERITRDAQNARWQLGPIQFEPKLSISDVGYVSNIYFASEEQAESDLKAKGSAGVRGFFNLGPKVLVSPFAGLTYAWWQNQQELRSWNESLGLQILGDFNRLQLLLQAGTVEIQRNLSSEVQVPVDRKTDRLELGLDVDFWGPFSFFGTASESQQRYFGSAAEAQVPGLDLATLESDEELLRGGFAYELGNGLRIGLGVEATDTRFLIDPGGRSNTGSGPLLTIDFKGPHLSLGIDAARRDIDFDGRGGNATRRQSSGRGQLRWEFTEKTAAMLYAGARLSASALDRAAVFESRRTGVNLQRNPGARTRFTAFFEVGEDEYATVASDEVARLDDIRNFGVNLQFQLGSRLSVLLGYSDARRESSDPAFDRNLRTFRGQVSLGGDLLTW
jgi:hypothetical protein